MRVLAVIVAFMFVGAALQQSIAPVKTQDCLPKVFGLLSVFQTFDLKTFLADQKYNQQVVAAVLDTVKACAALLPVPQLAQATCKSLVSNALSLLKEMAKDLVTRNWTKLASDRTAFMASLTNAKSVCSK